MSKVKKQKSKKLCCLQQHACGTRVNRSKRGANVELEWNSRGTRVSQIIAGGERAPLCSTPWWE